MSELWNMDVDWDTDDDVPAWLPDIPINKDGNLADEQDESSDWEEDDDLEEIDLD